MIPGFCTVAEGELVTASFLPKANEDTPGDNGEECHVRTAEVHHPGE